MTTVGTGILWIGVIGAAAAGEEAADALSRPPTCAPLRCLRERQSARKLCAPAIGLRRRRPRCTRRRAGVLAFGMTRALERAHAACCARLCTRRVSRGCARFEREGRWIYVDIE